MGHGEGARFKARVPLKVKWGWSVRQSKQVTWWEAGNSMKREGCVLLCEAEMGFLFLQWE